jgi:hypothetical protein
MSDTQVPIPPSTTTTSTTHTIETVTKTPFSIQWHTIPLTPWITSFRESITQQINSLAKQRNCIVEQYNNNIRPVNQALQGKILKQFANIHTYKYEPYDLSQYCLGGTHL